MNIAAKSDFNFQGKALVPVSNIAGVWFTSADLASALKYSNSRAVTMLYNKYADEFSSGMSQVLEVSTSTSDFEVLEVSTSKKVKNLKKKVRVFSLRGAHLIAMFARSDVAKDFRRWVLDLLDREVAQGNVNPVSKRIYSMSLSSDEMCSLAWLYKAAVHLQEDAQMISKAMDFLNSPVITGLGSIAHHYKFVLEDAGTVLAREIGKNVDESMDSTNWKRALSTLQIH